MTKTQKLQKLHKVFTAKNLIPDFSSFDVEVNRMKANLAEKITIPTLAQVGIELERFKKKLDLQPLIDSLSELQMSFDEKVVSLSDEIELKTKELSQSDALRAEAVSLEIASLQAQLIDLEKVYVTNISDIQKSIPNVTDLENRIDEFLLQLNTRIDVLEEQEITDWQEKLDILRIELLARINSVGGGSMNRKITFNGTDFLTKYTDINYKAGTNVTFTIATNNVTKMVDVTISATGGGGGGITRVITNVAVNTIADATPTTDYVYLCSGTMTLTMPTAVGNSNLYTVKNTGAGIVTIASSDTIDGSPTLIMPIQFTSVDLISNTAAWVIT